MWTEPKTIDGGPARKAPGAQAGFTLMEVMVALVVFVISVVGLVSMQARSLEAQKAATEIRTAERLAQREVQDILSRGFYDMLRFDFGGGTVTQFPYNDDGVNVAQRLRGQAKNFAADATGKTLGGIQDSFQVYRTVDMVVDGTATPVVSNPPNLPDNDSQKYQNGNGGDMPNILALEIEVLVMWVDRSNPAFPPPATATAASLKPENIDPLDAANFQPWVGHVRLRTVRVNDVLVRP